ncbi:MAG: terpene synthase family protein, partial [Ktedonobacteraceae bacterium]
WEARNRAQGLTPDIEVYIEKRQNTGAMLLALDFIDLTEHISITPEMYSSSQVQLLLRVTNNAVCWSNDILSLEKEIARGDLNNLVLAVRQQHNCPLQEAIERVNAMITSEIKLFETLAAQLPTLSPAYTQELQKYVAAMQAWIRGNLDWSIETQRYSHIEHPPTGKGLSYLEDLLPDDPAPSTGNDDIQGNGD